jgi:hypothetical protein
MMTRPDRKTVSRLSSICSRLGSQFEGERAVAALLATRMLGELGLDWGTVITRAFAEQPASMRSAQSFEPAPIDEAITLRLYRSLLAESWLNPWEREFVGNLLEKEAVSLSAKQQRCLNVIIHKHAAAAAKAARAAAAAKEGCHVA